MNAVFTTQRVTKELQEISDIVERKAAEVKWQEKNLREKFLLLEKLKVEFFADLKEHANEIFHDILIRLQRSTEDQALKVQSVVEKAELIAQICTRQKTELREVQETLNVKSTSLELHAKRLRAEQKRNRDLQQKILALEREKNRLLGELRQQKNTEHLNEDKTSKPESSRRKISSQISLVLNNPSPEVVCLTPSPLPSESRRRSAEPTDSKYRYGQSNDPPNEQVGDQVNGHGSRGHTQHQQDSTVVMSQSANDENISQHMCCHASLSQPVGRGGSWKGTRQNAHKCHQADPSNEQENISCCHSSSNPINSRFSSSTHSPNRRGLSHTHCPTANLPPDQFNAPWRTSDQTDRLQTDTYENKHSSDRCLADRHLNERVLNDRHPGGLAIAAMHERVPPERPERLLSERLLSERFLSQRLSDRARAENEYEQALSSSQTLFRNQENRNQENRNLERSLLNRKESKPIQSFKPPLLPPLDNRRNIAALWDTSGGGSSNRLPLLSPRRLESRSGSLPLVATGRQVTESTSLLKELTRKVEEKKSEYMGFLNKKCSSRNLL